MSQARSACFLLLGVSLAARGIFNPPFELSKKFLSVCPFDFVASTKKF